MGVVIFSLFLLALGLFIAYYANYNLQEIKKDDVKEDYYNSSYFVFTRNEINKVSNNSGMLGEYKTYNTLRAYEEIGGKFLFNVYLPKEDGTTTEIDMLFLTPKAIFVIESKNYSGYISGGVNDIDWKESFGNRINIPFYNPIKQNQTHIKALRNYIGDVLPIYSIVVFSDKCKLGYVPNNVKNTFVINRIALPHLIKSLLNNNEQIMTYKEVDEIQKALFPFSQKSEAEKIAHIRNVRNTLNKISNQEEELADRRSLKDVLEHFRTLKSEIYNIAKSNVLDDQELDRLLTFQPKTMDELKEWNILPLSKLNSHGEDLLKTINEYLYTEKNIAKKRV